MTSITSQRNADFVDFFRRAELSIRSCQESIDLSDDDWIPASTAASDRAMRLMRAAGKRSTVYLSAAPTGDGGISLSWRARSQSIVLEISESGDTGHLYATDDAGTVVINTTFNGDVDPKLLGQMLDKLTTRVEMANPGWRNAFRA